MTDQAHRLRELVDRDRRDRGRARIIAVASGKGGVGKTNLTVNLAIALAALGRRVLVIDADIGTANVDVVLGTAAKYNLFHLIENEMRITDVIAAGPGGISYLSGGSGLGRLTLLDEDAFQRIIAQLSLCEELADIILFDTGAGIGRTVLNFIGAADEVIVVTTPEPTAITDAYAMLKAYRSYGGVRPVNLVVNRLTERREYEAALNKLVKTAARFLGLTVVGLGGIDEDRNLIKAVKRQQPVMLLYPQSVASRCIASIARTLDGGECGEAPRGMRSFLTKMFGFLK